MRRQVLLSGLLLLALPTAYAVDVCGVQTDEDFLLRNDASEKLLSVDGDGTTVIYPETIIDLTSVTNSGFQVQTAGVLKYTFTTSTYELVGEVLSSMPSTTDDDDLVIADTAGNHLAQFDASEGDFTHSGELVTDGVQANCPSDGYYCDGDNREDRDYYCDTSTEDCQFTVLSSTTCQTGASDGDGIDYLTDSSCTDDTGCSGGSCQTHTDYDYCSGDTIYEYYDSGGTCYQDSADCTNQCFGEKPGTGCSGDTCNTGSSCPTGASDSDGSDIRNQGQCTDDEGCVSGSCETNTDYDYCSGSTLYEYDDDFGYCSTTSYDCTNQCFGDSPGTGCSGGECTAGSACATGASDSDGGQDKETQGTCTDYNGCSSGSCTQDYSTDYCSGDTLIEYYNGGGYCASTSIDCSYKCEDGACQDNPCAGKNCPTGASDSDGYDLDNAGTCTDDEGCNAGVCTSSSYNDYCSGFTVTEYTGGSSCSTSSVDCRSQCFGDRPGKECSGGACTKGSACATGTSETDGGKDYQDRGTCTDYNGCSGGSCSSSSNTDYCADSNTLVEYYSEFGSCSSEQKDCSAGCDNGACNEPAQTVTCYVDSDGDGYGAESSSGTTYTGTTSCPSGEVKNNDDCYDGNAEAKPGGTYAYDTHRGDGSWDYNCDGEITKLYSKPSDSGWLGSYQTCSLWGEDLSYEAVGESCFKDSGSTELCLPDGGDPAKQFDCGETTGPMGKVYSVPYYDYQSCSLDPFYPGMNDATQACK